MGKIIDLDELWQVRPEHKNEEQIGHEAENKAWNDCMKAWHDAIEEAPSCDSKLYDEGYAKGVKDTEAVYENYSELKHGYWIDGYYKKCSVCHYTISSGTPYCPACGAKMDAKIPELRIKGIEMPKDCYECFAFSDSGDYPTCIITHMSKGYSWSPKWNKMDNCPLVEAD